MSEQTPDTSRAAVEAVAYGSLLNQHGHDCLCVYCEARDLMLALLDRAEAAEQDAREVRAGMGQREDNLNWQITSLRANRRPPGWLWHHEWVAKLLTDGWMCEAHPGQPFPHDDCAGPGMPWLIAGKAAVQALAPPITEGP